MPSDNPKTQDEKEKRRRTQSVIHQGKYVGRVTLGGSWERRYQTLAMFTCSLNFVMPFGMLAWCFTLYYFFGGPWHYQELATHQLVVASCMAIYMTFLFLLDTAPTTGSRTPHLRKLRDWWNHSCDYLPLQLVKTADLPSDGNYVLGYHPHGIISVGCFGAFATDGARTLDMSPLSTKTESERERALDDNKRGFSSLFPGLDRRVITLPQNFQTPFMREYFLSMGACTSGKETFRNVLAKPSTAIIVVVGGASESMHAKEGTLELVLETRRGFVREAIMAKASLVPVIAFGENDLYKTYETDRNSFIGKVQTFVKKNFGVAMPVFQGRTLFFLDFGVMPQRKPVNVIVGAPIPPPKLDKEYKEFAPKVDRKTDEAMNDDGEILKQHHAKYVKALEELYNKFKNVPWNSPGRGRRESMKIMKK